MKFTEKRIAQIMSSLLLIFSIAFISIPYLVGGHPGELESMPANTQAN